MADGLLAARFTLEQSETAAKATATEIRPHVPPQPPYSEDYLPDVCGTQDNSFIDRQWPQEETIVTGHATSRLSLIETAQRWLVSRKKKRQNGRNTSNRSLAH